MGLVHPFHLVVLGQEAERTIASLPNRVLADPPPPSGLFFGFSACRRTCQLAFTHLDCQGRIEQVVQQGVKHEGRRLLSCQHSPSED
jgi:hypothetical protein